MADFNLETPGDGAKVDADLWFQGGVSIYPDGIVFASPVQPGDVATIDASAYLELKPVFDPLPDVATVDASVKVIAGTERISGLMQDGAAIDANVVMIIEAAQPVSALPDGAAVTAYFRLLGGGRDIYNLDVMLDLPPGIAWHYNTEHGIGVMYGAVEIVDAR